jgi:hypothetical protein
MGDSLMDILAIDEAAADAAAKYLPTEQSAQQWVPLGYRPRTPYNSSGNALAAIQSNGVNLGGTSKFMDEAQVSGHGIVTEFDLFINSNGEAENGFDVTVESCVISFANAVNLPFTFSGKLSHVIQGTRWGIFRVRSDVLGISVPKGQVYSILTRVSVASGSKYPITIIARRGNYEEGWSADPAVAGPGPDLTPFGTAWAPVAGVTRIFAPSVILTRPDTRTLSIMFLTDSIGVGTGESIVPNNSRWDEGWCTRAVRNKWPHFVLGLSGVTIAKWINPVTNPQASIRRRTVMENIHHTDVVVQQGVNDFQGGATTAQAQVLALSQWKDLAKYGRADRELRRPADRGIQRLAARRRPVQHCDRARCRGRSDRRHHRPRCSVLHHGRRGCSEDRVHHRQGPPPHRDLRGGGRDRDRPQLRHRQGGRRGADRR